MCLTCMIESLHHLHACKCSHRAPSLAWITGRQERAQGRPVVTAFQDLCLGAPLSGVLLLLPLDGRNRKEQQVLWVTFRKVTSFCCRGNLVSLRLSQSEQSDLWDNVCYTRIDWESHPWSGWVYYHFNTIFVTIKIFPLIDLMTSPNFLSGKFNPLLICYSQVWKVCFSVLKRNTPKTRK